MKILIAYHSQTGNTKLIAETMNEALLKENVTLLPAIDVDPKTLEFYDLVIIGSGIYGGQVGKSIKKLMKNAINLPEKFILFSTHSSEDRETHIKAFARIRKVIEGDFRQVLTEFDCLGENKMATPERQELFLANLTPEKRKEAEEYIQKLKGHPNIDDLNAARDFIKSIIKEM